MKRKIPRVALLVETSRSYGRGVLQGVVRYSRLHGPWSFYITPGDFEQALPKMKQWGGTGIIARIETTTIARAIQSTGLPTIGLDLPPRHMSLHTGRWEISEMHPDPVAAINMAVDHLLERSFKRLAFVGIVERIWSEQRQEAFLKRVASGQIEQYTYEPPQSKRGVEWGQEQKFMADWLKSLPKPVGLVCCNDDRGRQVLEAARAAEVHVPDEVAVIGIDDDELLCDLSNPPLSSVALNAERGGYEAAQLLDGMMSRRIRKPRQLTIEPLWVVTRQSTDVLAIDDRLVAEALRRIREYAFDSIGVEYLLEDMPISRRSLEVRFRQAVGRTLHQEIQRVRLERTRQLLLETDFTTDQISEMTGFASASYLGQVFHKMFGQTPTQYRRSARSR